MIYRLSDFYFPDDAQRLYRNTDNNTDNNTDQNTPLVLEIGFGDGRFWPHYAAALAAVGAATPNYLGVELSGVSLLKAHRRLKTAGISNAILSKMPADVLLREVVAKDSLDAIIINFPDPWPKADHTDNRLLRVPFFNLAASRLKKGGVIMLTTDHDEYFEFACAEAKASGVMSVELTFPPASALETKYAKKWRDLGLAVHHARFTSTQQPDVPYGNTTPYIEDTPEGIITVPHAILTLPPSFSPSDFDKLTVRNAQQDWTVILLDLYSSLRRDGWVVLAHVVEGELTQEVLIGITYREDGTHLVRLAKFGGPIITSGVKAAVGAVTQWLESAGGVVKHTGY